MNTITANQMVYSEDISAKAKAVFQYLAFRSNKHNTCFPGLKTIARDCALSVSSVQRGLRELLSAGLIRKKHNYRENGSQTSNIYELIEAVADRVQAAKDNLQQQIRELHRRVVLIEEKKQQVELNLYEKNFKKMEKGEKTFINAIINLFKFKHLTTPPSQLE